MAFLHRDGASCDGSSKAPRRRDQFLGLFSRSRSRSPSLNRARVGSVGALPANQPLSLPSADHWLQDCSPSTVHEANTTPNKPTERQTPKEGLTDSLVTPQVAVTEVLDFAEEGLGLPESAYQKALSSFGNDEREKLMEHETVRRLFQQLNASDHGHEQQSFLRKGLKAVKPYLERVNITIDFISPFASVEPAAGTALGLVKGAVSVAIAICGRFEDMTKDIATLLERIPAIDRCSDVAGGGGSLPDIYNALVNVYEDLLRFYIKVVTLFEENRFALGAALSAVKPEIADIVSSFTIHADRLSKLLEAESFASIQEIKDEQVDTLIRDTLELGTWEWDFRNELQQRADDACSWVTSSDSFSYWLLNARDSNLLALFGDMGTGKTITTAFVADTLAARDRPLCAYYCKDEHEAAKLGSIYRSILLQFIKQKPGLKLRFWKWYKDTSPQVSGIPTQSDQKLRGFLYDIISSSREPVFIVLDALDECDAHPRKQLFSLFGDLFKDNARLKVFISSRYDDDIEADLPPGVTKIELRSSHDRDRAIASYLVTGADLRRLAEFRTEVIEELAARARGSAIWLRIAVQYLVRSRVSNGKGLRSALDRLPSSEALSSLYGKLFHRVCDEIPENVTLVQHALEILAVARRALTIDELSYAVFTISPEDDEGAVTFSELDELAQSVNILDLIRPFVSAAQEKGEGSPRLRLVHQSLKELILTAPPAEWCSAEAMAKRQKAERVARRTAELNADLLQRCIKYLLFEECGTKTLFPSPNHVGDAEFLALGRMFDEDDTSVSATSPMAQDPGPPPPRLNAFERGFGHFFTYAAAYWTGHFSDVSPELRPDPQQLIVLCQRDSRRLENWVEQWRRPNCSFAPEYDSPEPRSYLDPVVVASLFGPAASVTDLLRLNLDSSVLTNDSVRTAVGRLICRGHISTIRDLIYDETLQSTLCSYKFLYGLVYAWRRPVIAQDDTPQEWEEIFELLINRLRDDLLSCGNHILRRAAKSGCLALIKKLLDAAKEDADLRRAILEPDVELSRGGGDWSQHQSIGEAAFEGRADVVRFLCEHPMLESHLRYVSHQGHTVFHLAARCGYEEVFQPLIRHWPEGVNVRNKGNDTPLNDLIFNGPSPMHEPTIIKRVRFLIYEGKADATGRNDAPGHSPLCAAVRSGYTGLLRVLIVEGGADALQAVDIDEATGRPFLKKAVQTMEDAAVRERMLKEMCSLLPLAVSVEYLS